MGSVAWTACDPLERGSANEDPLGFHAYAMRLMDEWLPGITTRTRRIRCCSMICGGLQLIEEEDSLEGTSGPPLPEKFGKKFRIQISD